MDGKLVPIWDVPYSKLVQEFGSWERRRCVKLLKTAPPVDYFASTPRSRQRSRSSCFLLAATSSSDCKGNGAVDPSGQLAAAASSQ